jgi:hypothetical protein
MRKFVYHSKLGRIQCKDLFTIQSWGAFNAFNAKVSLPFKVGAIVGETGCVRPLIGTHRAGMPDFNFHNIPKW